MGRLFVLIVLIAFLYSAAALYGDDYVGESAGDRAIEYVEAFMDGRISEAYEMLALEEREGVTLTQFESYIRATFSTADLVTPVRDSYPSFYEFVLDNLYRATIVYIEELDESQRVNIELSTIDLLAVAFEVAEKFPEVNAEDVPDEEIDKIYQLAISELYINSEPPRTAITVLIEVASEDGILVVLPGIRKSFDRMRAGELSRLAWDARFDGRTEYAAELYAEAVELDPDNSAYRQELESLNARLDAMRELLERGADGYSRDYLSIDASKAEVSGFPVIVCSIRNSGSTIVDRVEFVIAYLDETGMLMDVETGIHDFGTQPLGRNEQRRDVRIDTYETPFSWSGNKFDIRLLRHNP